MRIIRIVLTLIIIIFIGMFLFMKRPSIKKNKLKERITNITSLYYSYSAGTAINSNVRYSIICEDKCNVEIKPINYSEEDKIIFETSKEILKDIERVLNKYDVLKWDGFNKTDEYVLDGDSFSFSVEGSKNISASGYMMYPKKYSEVTSELEAIFDKINPTVKKELFSLEEYQDLKLENIEKVVLKENIKFNDQKKEFTEKNKIEYYYNIWNNVIVLGESKENHDISRIIKFVTNNKEYIINDSYDLILLGDKWYYYKNKS